MRQPILIDDLEARCLFADIINITTLGNDLFVTGDGGDNTLFVFDPSVTDPDSAFKFVIAQNEGTEFVLNGKRLASSFFGSPNRYDHAYFDTGDGDDVLTIGAGDFGVVRVNLGDGNNRLGIGGNLQALEVFGSAGDDVISFGGFAKITGNTSLFPGSGRDRVYFTRSTLGDDRVNESPFLGGKLWVQKQSGPLRLTADRLTVRRETVISTGNSIDRVTFANCDFGRQIIIGARGNDDVIDTRGSVFRATYLLFPGAGDNTVLE